MRLLGWLGAALCVVPFAGAQAAPFDPGKAEGVGGAERVALTQSHADPSECRVIDLEMQPAAGLQIVAWIEDPQGNFIDTIYITAQTGSFGLGNRVGVMGMRSGPHWPYGPRFDVFPVWSHRHGLSWPLVHFQNADGDPGGALDCQDTHCRMDPDRNLSHPFTDSSMENHFSRPIRPDEAAWDAGTGASPAFTDKGALSQTLTSLYPPRDDVVRQTGLDSTDVDMYDDLNPFDAVSQATPIGDAPYRYTWLIPPELDTGGTADYVMFVEVAKEFDMNATYNENTQPPTTSLGFIEYGKPYRGQPSVVYRVPFTIGPDESREVTASYEGYGNPAFSDRTIRPPDATITTDTPGSGALRLAVVHDALTGDTYQVRVDARFEVDEVAPSATTAMNATNIDQSSADLEFVAPGDDGMIGRASGYDVRIRTGEPITYDNFGASTRVPVPLEPAAAGERQSLHLDGLLPFTDYYVAIRAFDSCRNYGPIQVVQLTTLDRESGEVDACFVATAAYGSVMANDVQMLRRFRDVALRSNVLGELAVEAYYTFGPAVAGVVGESELLRATARGALRPVVDRVRDVTVGE